jgi:SAM-dependent methyltransferase
MRYERPEGTIQVDETGDGRRRVHLLPDDRPRPARPECVTRYPLELVEAILELKGSRWVCDEIMRDEDPDYVELALRADLLAFVPAERFAGARLLDFGCGSGASTMVLRRMFPDAEVCGLELEEGPLAIAERRARFYRADNVSFQRSPHPAGVPPNLGSFDFIVMSAVYEHLLPGERDALLPLLWSHLRPGGVLFVNQTPHRWFPVERHTTGLPGLNYLPDGVALRVARRFSSRVRDDESWPTLLRKGIRGGSEPEIVRRLRAAPGVGPFRLLPPTQLGGRDATDIWRHVAQASGRRSGAVAWFLPRAYRLAGRLTGSQFGRQISVAVAKPDAGAGC